MDIGDVRGWGWLAGLALLFGLTVSESRRFERRAAADVAAQLEGPRKSVRVGARFDADRRLAVATIYARDFSTDRLPLFAEPEREGLGELGELRLELRDFSLAGLPIARLDARIPDCRYDLGLALRERRIRLQRSGVGEGEVTVRQEALGPWIAGRYREILRADVRLDRHHVEVEGDGEFLVAKARFRVVARLQPVDGVRLELVDARIWMDDRPADPLARAALLKLLNPVVDLDRDLGLHGAIAVDRLAIGRGELTAFGRVRIPVRPPDDSR